MEAKEARELMKGSIKHKGLWFKARLNWFCGRINKQIEDAAERGESYIQFTVRSDNTAKRYFSIITQFYEDLGYYVAFAYHNNTLEIYWDLSDLSQYTIERLCTNSYYYHHIKLEESENESNCTSSRNRENERTPSRSSKDKRNRTNPKQKSPSGKGSDIRNFRS